MSHADRYRILGSLVDFSFTSFVTMELIKALYVLAFSLGALFSVGLIFSAFSDSFAAGLVSLILIPILFCLFAMYLRVVLEVLSVVFRIAEDVRALAAAQQGDEAARP